MRFLAYERGRCKLECFGWLVLRGGRLVLLGLFGDFVSNCGEREGDGE